MAGSCALISSGSPYRFRNPKILRPCFTGQTVESADLRPCYHLRVPLALLHHAIKLAQNLRQSFSLCHLPECLAGPLLQSIVAHFLDPLHRFELVGFDLRCQTLGSLKLFAADSDLLLGAAVELGSVAIVYFACVFFSKIFNALIVKLLQQLALNSCGQGQKNLGKVADMGRVRKLVYRVLV